MAGQKEIEVEWTLLSKPTVITDGLRVLTDVQMVDLQSMEPKLIFYQFLKLISCCQPAKTILYKYLWDLYIPYTLGTFSLSSAKKNLS